MIMKNILIGMALILVTSNCVSAEKMDDVTAEGLEPFKVVKGQVTANVIAESLKRGRRVLVIFDEFIDSDDNTWKCPVKIRTVDNVCEGKGFQNSDPSVICRWAGDSVDEASQTKIRWEAEEGDPFTITFPSGAEPCKAASWDGDEFELSHRCNIKTKAYLEGREGDAIFLKYDVAVKEARCDKLDPYFIVRK